MGRISAVLGLVALVVAAEAHVSAPARRSSSRTYTVRRGDTLSTVAKRHAVPVAALAKANDIADADRVRVGQVLSIPTGGEPTRATVTPPPPLPSPVVVVGGPREHTVERGETLAAIAARYGTSVGELASANSIKNRNLIREGKRLRVPAPPWLCPVQGRRDFADSWGAARPGHRRHLGVDVFARRGTPVVASVSGVLEHASGAVAGLAYYLRGDDGNTYYGAHLDSLAQPGRVPRGAVVGAVGTTGNARGTSPHLHFEIKPGGGSPVNPYPSLKRWC